MHATPDRCRGHRTNGLSIHNHSFSLRLLFYILPKIPTNIFLKIKMYIALYEIHNLPKAER
jgi:hypothetical protein